MIFLVWKFVFVFACCHYVRRVHALGPDRLGGADAQADDTQGGGDEGFDFDAAAEAQEHAGVGENASISQQLDELPASVGLRTPPAHEAPGNLGEPSGDAARTPAQDWFHDSPAKRRRLRGNVDFLESFLDRCQQNQPDPTRIPKDVGGDPDNIVATIREYWNQIRSARPTWPPVVAHLTVGALAVHRLRVQDSGLQEEVMLLYLIEGGTYLRAHNGQCYAFSAFGHWERYSGLVPQSTLARTKRFLLRLEGLFSKFEDRLDRSPEAIIGAVSGLFNRFQTEELFLQALEGAGVNSSGAPKGRGRSSRAGKGAVPEDAPGGDDDAEPDLPDDPRAPWPKLMTRTLCKLSGQLQRALMSDTIFTYYTEWCDTPDPRVSGACFPDTAFLFDHDGQNVVHVTKAPERNVYLYIPHPLLDPVLPEAAARVRKFMKDRCFSRVATSHGNQTAIRLALRYVIELCQALLLSLILDSGGSAHLQETFWKNGMVLECHYAALALALRGCNVDRAFWGLGPGGVGQSLFTAHLEAQHYIQPNWNSAWNTEFNIIPNLSDSVTVWYPAVHFASPNRRFWGLLTSVSST